MDLSNLAPQVEGYEPVDITSTGIPSLVQSEVKSILNDAYQQLLFKPEEPEQAEEPKPEDTEAEDTVTEDTEADTKELSDEEETEGSVVDNASEEKKDSEKDPNSLRFAKDVLASVIRDLSREDLVDALTLVKKASKELKDERILALRPLEANLKRIAIDLEEMING